MPLSVTSLTKSLIDMDTVAPAKDAREAASRWADVLTNFNSGMTYLIPGAANLGKPLLFAALLPAFLPVSTFPVFVAAIEAGLRAFWVASVTPATITIPSGVYTPSPIILAPLLLPVAPIGLVSPVSAAPRIFMATQIYAWTLTNAITAPGPVITPFI